MSTGNKLKKVINLLKKHYYANIILLAVLFLLILFRALPFFMDGQTVGITIERYAIVITIIVIPLSLKFFANRLKKLSPPLDIETATDKYKKASYLRLYSITAVTLMHIILYGVSRNMNYLWFTVVLFIIYMYCKPSYGELEALTREPEKQLSEEAQAPPHSLETQNLPDRNGTSNLSNEEQVINLPNGEEEQ